MAFGAHRGGNRCASTTCLNAVATATVQFPASTQLITLDRTGIYLVRVDGDGLQTLERHAWPAALR